MRTFLGGYNLVDFKLCSRLEPTPLLFFFLFFPHRANELNYKTRDALNKCMSVQTQWPVGAERFPSFCFTVNVFVDCVPLAVTCFCTWIYTATTIRLFKKKKNIVWIKYVVCSFAQTVIIILSTIQLQVVSSKSGVSWAGSCALTILAASLQPHQRQFFFLKSNTLQLALQLMLNQLRSIFFHLINNGSNERTYVMELVCSEEPTENSAAL